MLPATRCLRCEADASSGACSFIRDYRTSYRWSCCGGHDLGLDVDGPEFDGPPPCSPGCSTEETHIRSARALLLAKGEDVGRLGTFSAPLRAEGFDPVTMAVDRLAPDDLQQCDCVALFVDGRDQFQVEATIEQIREKRPDLNAIVLLIEGEADSLPVHAERCDAATPELVSRALSGALRRGVAAGKRITPEIFFSYRRRESGYLMQLTKGIIDNAGPIWIDRNFLYPGVHWSSEIRTAIERARLFVMACADESSPLLAKRSSLCAF